LRLGSFVFLHISGTAEDRVFTFCTEAEVGSRKYKPWEDEPFPRREATGTDEGEGSPPSQLASRAVRKICAKPRINFWATPRPEYTHAVALDGCQSARQISRNISGEQAPARPPYWGKIMWPSKTTPITSPN